MWQTFPFEIPSHLQIVWIRMDRWSGAPFLAEFDAATQTFTSVINSIVYPLYLVSTWKSQ